MSEKKGDQNKAEEPETAYQNEAKSKEITVSSLEEMKELDRKHTARLSPLQRMEYLQKLNRNLFGTDLSHQRAVLRKGEITIKKRT